MRGSHSGSKGTFGLADSAGREKSEYSLFKLAFDIIPISIVVVDKNAIVRHVNETALKLINKSREEIVGKLLGESINCVTTFNDGEKCGQSRRCENCGIRKAVEKAYNEDLPTEGLEIFTQLVIDGKLEDFWFEVNVRPIYVDKEKSIVISLLDITEKKKREQSLIEARDYSYNILNQMPTIVWMTNKFLRCEYVSKGWEAFTGLAFDKALGRGIARAFNRGDLKKSVRAMIKASSKKRPFHVEARLKNKNGEMRDCLIIGKPYYDLHGEFDGYIGTILDITEHKEALESLYLYKNLAEITDDIIFFLDLDGNIIEANRTAVKAYGYTYDELRSINIWEIRPGWSYTREQLEKANSSGIYFEAVHRRKDGSTFDVEVSSKGTNIDGRQVISSIVRDITRRKMAETKLKEQEERFRTIFEQAPIGMAFCSSDGEIIDVNPMVEKFFGRNKEELIKSGWGDIINPDGAKDDELERYLSGAADSYTATRKYSKSDGTVVWGSLIVTRLSIEGGSKHLHLLMLENHTEKIKTLDELKESERSKAVLLSNLPGMAYRCNYDKDWTMQFVSDGCFALTGYRPESLLYNRDLTFNDLINPEYREYLWEKWREVIANGTSLKEEYAITTATGEVKWVYEQGMGIYDDEGNVVALEGLIIDISARKKREEEILYLTYHDVLTGLHNRIYFEKAISDIDVEKALPLSVIVGDVNGLKGVNEALGYELGDELLVSIAKILEGFVREKDILARTGGDDFTILLPNTPLIEAERLMEKIKAACNKHIREDRKFIYLTSFSLGCSCITNPKEKIIDAIRKAEGSMYRNKLLQDESLHSSIILSLKTTLFEKSQETEEHALRLVELSREVGKRLNLSEDKLNELELLSTLHDIGKIGVSDSILNKAEKLTPEEWEVINKHPEIGYRIAMATPTLSPIAEYILCHHEHYNGNGYPRGLKGEEIPLLARIISIVDAYDAMTQDRVYRKAMTKRQALEEIKRNSGKQFDPEIVKIFVDIVTQRGDLEKGE